MKHPAHDYPHLIARWRAVAEAAGLEMRKLARAGKADVFTLRSAALAERGGIYVSAGIHGDEPGATEGLLAWAEKNALRLNAMPLLLAPCLNPWGLANNVRLDERGDDLNRLWHRDDHPVVGAMKRLVAGMRFALGLQLHEDYDGQGFYLYEVQRVRPYWGEALLAAAGRHIAIEPRTRIDGRLAREGLIRRRVDRRRFGRMGYPEAIWLHTEHSERTFTIESPSEFALERRVRAQVAVLGAAVRMAVNEGREGMGGTE